MRKEVSERDLPAGTVTFLFTDIQGSTGLLKQLGEAYANLLSDQREILRAAFEKWDGREIDTQGDAFFASFPRATQAVAAVIEIQRALAAHKWPGGVDVRVRMGLHTGEPWLVEEGYVGMDVHRAARIAHVGHGGQVLLSETTTPLVQDELPEGVELLDLGLHRLKDLRRPEHIHQLVIDGLPSDFPALKAKLVKPPAEASRPKSAVLPAFLGDNAQKTIVEAPVFVSRQVELEKLDGFLEKALTGQGRVVFLSGGPGRGKTAMIDHFARRSMEKHNDLLVISGGCDAYTGSGDPFRPFRSALGMLTGDLESRWAGGALTTDHARRLWDVVPITGAAIMEGGKDLLGTFFNATDLSKRAESAGHTDQDWYLELQTYLEEAPRAGSGSGKAGLLEQVARVLRSVAEIRPLILTLDDLQWADSASLDLLVHLDRELNGVRMLILGAYRPEEVALGRDGGRHPLEKMLAEFKRQYGDMQIELDVEDERGGRDFIDALLDTEPNHLSDNFRGALYKQTAGHPLFTVELLREMQTRGDLIRDENNSWIAGPALDWNVLPARVEGVIEERIGRLEEALRETLTIASVEGEDFTAQVVARVQQVKDQGIIRQLSRELDKKHRLVGEQASQQIGTTRLHRYRFRHSLFQQHLYNGLTKNEKEFLHADVGAVLEELYGESREQIAPQLAWHFDEAGQREKAIEYYLQAGDHARWFYAQAEAAQHYQNAADLLKGGDDDHRTARTLIKLGQAYHSLPDYQRAQQAYQEGFLIWERIREKARSSTPTNITETLHADWEEPVNLNPAKARTDPDFAVLKQLFSGLVKLNPEGDVIPEVARAWDIEENGKRYIFHLREDVQWSDGSPLTAGDFEFAWKQSYAGDITNVYAPNEMTLVVELIQPTSYFLYYLNEPFFGPVPRQVVRRYGDEWTRPGNMVSNGPFRLESWRPGESLTLRRNPYYYGHFGGNVDRVELFVELKANQKVDLYNADRIDILQVRPEIEHVRNGHSSEEIVVPRLGTYWLDLNSKRAPFDNPLVRQALAMAINKESMVSDVLKNLAMPAYGGLLPPKFPGYNPDIGLPFNPEKARQLLAQAGYPGGRGFPAVTLGTHHSRDYIGRSLCQHWQEHLNLTIELEVYPLAQQIARAKRNHFFILGWHADSPDPGTFLVDALEFVWNWQEEEYIQLVKQAQEVLDVRERVIKFQQAEKFLIMNSTVIPLFHEQAHWMVKPWVKFYHPPLSITHHFVDFKDVIIEPHGHED